jgi:hypothetical protein
MLFACNSTDKNLTETERLERFLNIPVYPGAEKVLFFTDDRDQEIPRKTEPASVSFIVDTRDSVPAFYERVLGHEFLVDTTGGKTYYKLVFDQEGWEYEIMVGQDRFRNKPMFTISVSESIFK